jgi:hypothetical protein
MTTDTANQIISKYESLVVLCTYNILLTNDICCGAGYRVPACNEENALLQTGIQAVFE